MISDTATGRNVFAAEIADLYAGDPHRPGSVDAVLLDRQQRLTLHTQPALYSPPATPPPYRRGSRPELERLVDTALEGATHELQMAAALTRFCARIPRLFPTPERCTAAGYYGDMRGFVCGGTEEEVILRGSPLAAERARVLCAMAQVVALPARVVFLACLQPAERHAVTEIFVFGRWTVFDGFSGRFYTWPKHGYASAWDLQRMPQLVDNAPDHGRQHYVDSAFYQHVAIAPYHIDDTGSYTYPSDPIPVELAERLRHGLGA